MQFEKVESFDSVKVFRGSLSSIEDSSVESFNLDRLKNQWILSVIGDCVTPLKIEWLDQEFAGAIRQQQIDVVIDSYPEKVISSAIDELMNLDLLLNSVVVLDKPAVELYISLADMLLSLDEKSIHEGLDKTVANLTQRYNPLLKVFFKVFNIGEIGFLKSGKSATLYILRWISEHIELLKTQGVTALLIDNFGEADEFDLDGIVGQLEAIQSDGLPLCFLQSDPPQVLGMSELDGIIAESSHVTFVVRGLLPEKRKSLHSSFEEDVTVNKQSKFKVDQKRKTYRKFGSSLNQLFSVDQFFDNAVDSNNIHKIFNLKLAGLTSAQIAKIFSITKQSRFQSINQNSVLRTTHSWSTSLVANIANNFYIFQKALKNEIREKLLVEQVLPKFISEDVFCLAMQSFIVSKINIDDVPIKLSYLLTDMLSSRIFCACDMHQEFLHEVKEDGALSCFSPLRQRVCDCIGVETNRNKFEDCIKSSVLALTRNAPRISNLHDVLNNELNTLIDDSGKAINDLKSSPDKKKITVSIDLCIGIIARKISWLSNSEIESRLCRFHAFFCKDVLDKSEALEFIELTRELIASVFLDTATGFIKIYWSHSLTVSEIQIGEIVRNKAGVAVLKPFIAEHFMLPVGRPEFREVLG